MKRWALVMSKVHGFEKSGGKSGDGDADGFLGVIETQKRSSGVF